MNRTLWERIGDQPAGFFEEVEELKRLVQERKESCKRFESISPEKRQQRLTNAATSESERECLNLIMSDAQFFDYTRELQRIDAEQSQTKYQCNAASSEQRVVWIKTHKTGSSTITNLFHRYAWRFNITSAMPRDDTYYGWPMTGSIAQTVAYPRGMTPDTHTFSFLVSGHVIYNRAELDRIVPKAKYVTLLRNPINHFASSWRYFQLSRFNDESGNPITMDNFLEHPDKYMHIIPATEHKLFHNSMSFDLGLRTSPKIEDAEAILNRFSDPKTGFSMVLISEYLDESLIVMRRKFCWDLDDIVTYSLKVNDMSRPRFTESQSQAILEFNLMDAILYDHFNRTLWDEIGKIPDFYKELEVLRTVRASMRGRCEIIAVPDRQQRAIILTSPRDSTKSQCARYLLDSVEFSKLLKIQQGVPHSECILSLPSSSHAFIKPRFLGRWGNVISSILLRKAVSTRSSLLIPPAGYNPSRNSDTLNVFSHIAEAKAGYLIDGSFQFKDQFISGLIRGDFGRYISVIPDPVERFMSAWKALGIQSSLKSLGESGDIVNALTSTRSEVVSLLEPIRNTVSRDLLPGGQITEISALLRNTIFSIVIPASADDSALIYLRRALCWSMEDVLSFESTWGPSSEMLSLSESTIRAIQEFNRLDTKVFELIKDDFGKKMEIEMGFGEEVKELRQLRESRRQSCKDYLTMTQEQLLLEVTSQPLTKLNQHPGNCLLQLLEPKSFEGLVKLLYPMKRSIEFH